MKISHNKKLLIGDDNKERS